MNRKQLASHIGALSLIVASVLGTACIEQVDDPGEIAETTETTEQALSGDGVSSNLEIPLVVVLWENTYWGGKKRQFIRNEPYLGPGVTQSQSCECHWTATYCMINGYPSTCFTCQQVCSWTGTCKSGPAIDNWASAVGVHPGPDYQKFINAHGFEPTVTLFSDENFGGASITLRAGSYANLGNYGMNDVVSSIRINELATPSQAPDGGASAIGFIRNVLRLHKNSNTSCQGGEPDTVITVVEDTWNVGAMYGNDWNDSVSAIDWWRGPNFDGVQPKLSEDQNFVGRFIGAGTWIWLGYNNISSFFNDCMTSISQL